MGHRHIIYHNLLWVSISYSFTIDCIDKKLITWGHFLSVNLYHVNFLSLSMALMMGDLLSSIRLVGCWLAVSELWHFAYQLPFLEHPLQMVFYIGQLSWPGGVNGCSWGTVKQTFVACFSGLDDLSGGNVWLCRHTSQLLQTQWCNM